jgi:hypothetical protein
LPRAGDNRALPCNIPQKATLSLHLLYQRRLAGNAMSGLAGRRGGGTRRDGGRGHRADERTVLIMKRIVAIAACGMSLAACSSMPSWMQFELPRAAPSATTMQFESEPAGAEARTSTGQTCRTPCSLAVTASEFTVSFALPGYQSQTVPVRVVPSNDPRDSSLDGEAAAARLVPNPVFVELQPGPPVVARKPAAPPKQRPRPAARPAPTAMAPEPPPAAAPASPWPPAPSR